MRLGIDFCIAARFEVQSVVALLRVSALLRITEHFHLLGKLELQAETLTLSGIVHRGFLHPAEMLGE